MSGSCCCALRGIKRQQNQNWEKLNTETLTSSLVFPFRLYGVRHFVGTVCSRDRPSITDHEATKTRRSATGTTSLLIDCYR
jgi:hypothetical protein